MVTMTVKGTSITVTCDNAEDLFIVWTELSWQKVCVVNGEELLARGVDNFGGYTRGFFKKYFQ